LLYAAFIASELKFCDFISLIFLLARYVFHVIKIELATRTSRKSLTRNTQHINGIICVLQVMANPNSNVSKA